MMDQLKSWLPRKPASADSLTPQDRQESFALALRNYPAHVPPHRGLGASLSIEQAQQNLDWFNRTLHERLAALRSLCAQTGWELGDNVINSLADALDLTARLIDWTRASWPTHPYLPQHNDDAYWAQSERVGPDAIFSVVLDLATLLGQTIMQGRSEWRWGLDLAPSSLGRQPMLSARRVVLMSPLLGAQRRALVKDLEALVLARYRTPNDLRFRCPLQFDSWIEYVRDGYTGREIDFFKAG